MPRPAVDHLEAGIPQADVVGVAIESHEPGGVVVADGRRCRGVERVGIVGLLGTEDDVVAPVQASEDLVELGEPVLRCAVSSSCLEFVTVVA